MTFGTLGLLGFYVVGGIEKEAELTMRRNSSNLCRLGFVGLMMLAAMPFVGVASAAGSTSEPSPTKMETPVDRNPSAEFLANPVAPESSSELFPASLSPSVVPTTPGYVAVNPARLMDTRPGQSTVDGQAAGGGALGSGVTRDLVVTGRGGVPASGVAAVALNVTVTGPTASSYLTVWPSGSNRPLASNLNYAPGDTVPNMVTVKVGTGGQISLYNNLGTVNVVVDVAGWYLTDAEYQPLVPARLMETRYGLSTVDGTSNGWGKIRWGLHADLTVLGRGGVPAANVSTVVLNVTVTGPTEAGYLTVWPTGEEMPLASNLNFATNTTIPNLVVAKVGANGQVSIYNSAGWTDVVVDVLGWYQSDTVFTSLSPARLMDSRSGQRTTDGVAAGGGAISSGATRTLQVTGRGGVPASGVGAVALNVTVTAPTGTGYLTVWPTGTQQPLASNLNFKPGQTIPNSVVAKVGSGGQISIFNSSGSSDVVVDVLGWFTSSVVSGPSAPQSIGVLEGTRYLSVSWALSENNGGSIITGYTATASPSGASCSASSTATTCDIPDLPYGVQQTVRVSSQNKIGLNSLNSVSVSGTPYAITSVSVGIYNACGTVSNGRAACWGPDYQWLGRGSSGAPNYRSGPQYVYTAANSPLENVRQVSQSEDFGCAVVASGSVYCWGYNRSGVIGIPANRDQSLVNAPYAVEVSPALTDATQVLTGSGPYGGVYACALRSIGSIKCWGSNRYGLLGNGSGASMSLEPVDVTGVSNATKIVGSGVGACALLQTNSVSCWGESVVTNSVQGTPAASIFSSGVTDLTLGMTYIYNVRGYGQSLCVKQSTAVKCLGTLIRNTSSTLYTSPVTMPGLPPVSKLASGDAGHTCLVGTDRSVWCWGENIGGILRDGTTMDNETPTQMLGVPPAMDVSVLESSRSSETCVVPVVGGYFCWGAWPESL